ncbi:MAG: NAD(P)/FAD-dependent oxidoreductase [Eubacteriales bacterium]
MQRIAIIGAGAAGMSAAVFAADRGAAVTVFERNALLGRKLGITGKGRCNLTNDCTPEEFMRNITANGKFLFSAIRRFDSESTKNFFGERLGVPLKTERGNRVFPVSDKATDIVLALKNEMRRLGVTVLTERVTDIDAEETEGGKRISAIITEKRRFTDFDSVIIATGGASYPVTGSSGDGYRFAARVGHTIKPLVPSLVGLCSNDRACGEMQGLALKNVGITVTKNENGKAVYRDFGELLFTHFGISGPTVLSASAHMRPMSAGAFSVNIDLKPALDEQTLDRRIMSDFEKYKNKDFANALGDLLPAKMIPVIIARCGIPPALKVNSVTKEQRRALLSALKCFRIDISGFRPIEEAIVTSGGVATSEIEPATMRSRICKNLYFAGEVIDVDAYTGGFNLQIAFSTAYSAALAASEKENEV